MQINGGKWVETYDVLEINDLINDRYKVQFLRKNGQSIILPVDTPKDYIIGIIKDVYDRLRIEYEKDYMKTIEVAEKSLERIKNFEDLVKIYL